MEKAIKRYWPVFVLPTLIAFIIGFVVAFHLGVLGCPSASSLPLKTRTFSGP